MARMQSQYCQCCCCALSIFSVLFGIIMTSTGVCLVLNYGILDVDTGGLPPEWRNEEGKKIVGIILICCGFGAMGMGAVVSTLYYTVCSKPKRSSVVLHTDKNKDGGRRHEGVAVSSSSASASASSSTASSSASNGMYSASMKAHTQRRHGKKSKNGGRPLKHGRYKSNLQTHEEEATEVDNPKTPREKGQNVSTQNLKSSSSNQTPRLPPIITVSSAPVWTTSYKGGTVNPGYDTKDDDPDLDGEESVAFSETSDSDCQKQLNKQMEEVLV